ncbi:hypothetical protein L1887_55100 [Cichorium endivia]|nr:hypothetical protein L1887_55100 [Cichorium endivia]
MLYPDANGESISQLHARARRVLDLIAQRCEELGVKRVLICSHAATIIAMGKSAAQRRHRRKKGPSSSEQVRRPLAKEAASSERMRVWTDASSVCGRGILLVSSDVSAVGSLGSRTVSHGGVSFAVVGCRGLVGRGGIFLALVEVGAHDVVNVWGVLGCLGTVGCAEGKLVGAHKVVPLLDLDVLSLATGDVVGENKTALGFPVPSAPCGSSSPPSSRA